MKSLIHITNNGTAIKTSDYSIIKYKIYVGIKKYLDNCKMAQRLLIINNIIDFEPNFYNNLGYNELINCVAQNLAEYLIDADEDKINKTTHEINYNYNGDDYFNGFVADCFYSLINYGHY